MHRTDDVERLLTCLQSSLQNARGVLTNNWGKLMFGNWQKPNWRLISQEIDAVRALLPAFMREASHAADCRCGEQCLIMTIPRTMDAFALRLREAITTVEVQERKALHDYEQLGFHVRLNIAQDFLLQISTLIAPSSSS